MYSKQWTQFETQSLAFAILRKSLFPDYLVRGDFGEITIYRPTADKNNPVKLLSIKVQPSLNKEMESFVRLDDATYALVGGGAAYKVLEHVKPLL